MVKIACHIQALWQKKYQEYAVICIDSLVKRGNVNYKDIHITVDKANDISNWLRRCGCNIRILDFNKGPANRLATIDKVFDECDADVIYQIDSDCILAENISLYDFAEKHNDYIMCHKNNMTLNAEIYEIKKKYQLYCKLASANCNLVYLLKVLGVDEELFLKDWLKNPYWTWGSFYLVNRKVRETAFWKVAATINEVMTSDDELSCIWGNYLDPKLTFINDLKQIHAYAEGDVERYLKAGTGIIHYAGERSKYLNGDFLSGLYKQIINGRLFI